MCTDGLSNMVEDEDMFDIVEGATGCCGSGADADGDRANSNGGRDNIGVVLGGTDGEVR